MLLSFLSKVVISSALAVDDLGNLSKVRAHHLMDLLFKILVFGHIALALVLNHLLKFAVLRSDCGLQVGEALLLEGFHPIDGTFPVFGDVLIVLLRCHHKHEHLLVLHCGGLGDASDIGHVVLEDIELGPSGLQLAILHHLAERVTHNSDHHVHHNDLREVCR